MAREHITIASLPEIVTVNEAADVLRVSRPTIVRMIHRGELTAIQVGNQYRIRKTSLTDQFLPASDTKSCNPRTKTL